MALFPAPLGLWSMATPFPVLEQGATPLEGRQTPGPMQRDAVAATWAPNAQEKPSWAVNGFARPTVPVAFTLRNGVCCGVGLQNTPPVKLGSAGGQLSSLVIDDPHREPGGSLTPPGEAVLVP